MFTRRRFVRESAGVAAACAASGAMGSVTLSGQELSEDFDGRTPFVTPPFVEPLWIPPVKQPSAIGDGCWSQVGGGFRNPRQPAHQQESADRPWGIPQKAYQLRVRKAKWSFHPAIPPTTIFGFDGIYPGPTFRARYGEPVMVRIYNELPPDHVGFGIPSITTHLHNGHTATESDGNPDNYFEPGEYWDNHYPNILPGVITGDSQDARETLGTLWYHDHRRDFTAQNVYAGLAGFYLLTDGDDCDDESNSYGLRLPSGEYDVPLVFADKVFGADGDLVYNFFNPDGILGDRFTVNGKVQPYFNVARRKYRFRLLDAGPARFYAFALSDGSNFYQIANDGNLFERPVVRRVITAGVAERHDVIVDFSKYKIGDRIYLLNRAEQDDGRGPTGKLLSLRESVKLIEFRVNRNAEDRSVIPSMDPNVISMREQPPIALDEVVAHRLFVFDRRKGGWTVNNEAYNPNRVLATPRRGVPEVWTLRNESGGWWHPVHIHVEECRIISRNGQPPPPWEAGRKDTIPLAKYDEVKVFLRFRDWLGKYPAHCHNVQHEDHAMMFRFDIID